MSQLKKFAIWTDGGSRGNPGSAGIGVRIEDSTQPENSPVAEIGEYIGIATNNQAEYRALDRAVDWLIDYCQNNKIDSKQIELTFYTDSELMAYQIQGRYKVKNLELKPIHERITSKLAKFASYTISPIRREKNSAADLLVNKALDQQIAQIK